MIDRSVRIGAGLALMATAFVTSSAWLAVVGLIPLLTGLVGYCPLYHLVGIRTCALPGSGKPGKTRA